MLFVCFCVTRYILFFWLFGGFGEGSVHYHIKTRVTAAAGFVVFVVVTLVQIDKANECQHDVYHSGYVSGFSHHGYQ
jgi:hypothetical protein